MDAHRIEVLDRANDDAVVIPVTDNLHLKLFPADNRLFKQHFGGWRHFKTVRDDELELFAVIGDTTARTAHRERWPNDRGEADSLLFLEGLFHRMRDLSVRTFQPDLRHRFAE